MTQSACADSYYYLAISCAHFFVAWAPGPCGDSPTDTGRGPMLLLVAATMRRISFSPESPTDEQITAPSLLHECNLI